MDETRKASITAALQRYRDTVLEHNVATLRLLVEGMESQPDPPNWPAGLAQRNRLSVFNEKYGMGSVTRVATSARDLLGEKALTELTATCWLDGVSHRPVNLPLREAWFDRLKSIIVEQSITVEPFPPLDLEYLCSQVQGVTGPGLPYYREAQQFALFDPVDYEDSIKNMINVINPSRDSRKIDFPYEEEGGINGVWEGWEVTVAFQMGSGPRGWGGSYALYCRNETRTDWKWRYGVHDEDWRSDLYDTIEEYLDFYAHFHEQTEEDTRRHIKSLGLTI